MALQTESNSPNISQESLINLIFGLIMVVFGVWTIWQGYYRRGYHHGELASVKPPTKANVKCAVRDLVASIELLQSSSLTSLHNAHGRFESDIDLERAQSSLSGLSMLSGASRAASTPLQENERGFPLTPSHGEDGVIPSHQQ
ncbi:MAG: hypothetical protein M1833_005812 [Piccolia ochrophora]|nr:MAG: hypothetical protein M1833_005812 [Piccolia ochrophora]